MKKKYQNFLSENFHVLVVKFSVYLNRQVFVMYAFVAGLGPHCPHVYDDIRAKQHYVLVTVAFKGSN